MKKSLAKELIKRNILKYESKVTAKVRAKGLAGDPVTVKKILVLTDINDDECMGYNTSDPDVLYPVKYSNISRFEGMTLRRLAEAYNMNDDGTKRKTGKKPGRKPKVKV